jgi:hypothetical protein
MKTNKILLVSTLAIVGLLASCGNKGTSSVVPTTSSTDTPTTSSVDNATSSVADADAKTVSFGLGYTAAYNATKSQFTVTIAAVGVDADKKVIDARVDCVQVNVGATATPTETEGTYTYTYALTGSNLDSEGDVRSKLELGKDYGMLSSSSMGAEVDTQMEAIADFCVGKTAEEIAAAETITGASIGVSDYKAAIASAFTHLRDAVTYTGDIYAGVGMTTSYGKQEYSEGAEASVTINGVMATADNKVVASFTDCVVADFTVSTAEDTTTLTLDTTTKYYDTTAEKIVSKYDLKEKYAMLGTQYGSSLAEWYTQAESFDAAIVGKTATEITSAESFSGVSIATGSFTKAAAESVTYATMEHVGPQAEATAATEA